MIAQKLKDSIQLAIHKLWPGTEVDFSVEHPEIEEKGDYATNAALILARRLKQDPLLVAQRLVTILEQEQLPEVEMIEAKHPGFVNFRLAPEYLLDSVRQIQQQKTNYGQSSLLADRKVVLEFGQPNTHKMPHIGHLFSYIYGGACTRLWQSQGATVKPVNYQGDVGLHVAKCLWAYQKNDQPDPATLAEQVQYLQRCYQQGSKEYDESQIAHAEIDHLNDKIYSHEERTFKLWQKTRDWSVQYYRQFEKRLGVEYDKHYFESEVASLGLDTVRQNIGKVFDQSDGAIIFRGEKYGLHTRVFANHFGHPTYEAKDIGLLAAKQKDFPDYELVITTATEQNDYWRVMIKVADLIFPKLIGRIKHLGFGMVDLVGTKMSSRTGNIVTGVGLVDLVTDKVQSFLDENRKDYSPEDKASISQAVAKAAIIYSFLKKAAPKNMSFDIESSIAFEGNSGPYLQYAYARCQSVLAKALAAGYSTELQRPKEISPEESALMRWLYRYPEVVSQAAQDYAPHLLCTYLYELAQRYSLFYDRQKMLVEDKAVAAFRLSLAQATGQILHNGLNLLGIDVLAKI
ncbi:MAG: arginine--tRNA ligase [Candidatus Komeilibacteria bacterium]